MQCVACGGEVPTGSRFCPRCGRAVPETSSAASDNPTAPPPPPAPPPSWTGGGGHNPPPAPPPSWTGGGGHNAPPGAPPGSPGGYGPPPGAPPGSPGGYGPPPGASPGPPGGYGAPPPPPPPGSFQAPPAYPGGYPPPYGSTSGPVAYGLASFGQRVGATLIDGFVVWAFIIVATIIGALTTPESTFDDPDPDPSGIGILLMMVGWLVSIVYPIYFEGRPEGQTLGKKALGIRVVRKANGAPIGFGLAIGRFLARFVNFFTLGFGLLWAAWDPLHQAFHDKIAGTLVVKTSVYPPPNANAPGSFQPAPPPNPYHSG